MASRQIDLSAATWCKSSYSNGSGGDCIEVADDIPGLVPVRDTKTAPNGGPTVLISAAAWTRFVAAVKDDAFHA
ncbi:MULTISPECIES: DUF397 domain-containing protein [unclassified Streptomyces]|uniref:DUF397 domain-containing protein n=1 Tax=unclassified Streptomyces TaxID=2593676 RepID=UPI00382111CB